MARGVAVVLMIAYHAAWDLTWFELVDWPLLTNPLWLGFRNLIVCLFLSLVGVALVLATRGGLRRRPFLRRLLVIAAAAGAITLATWLLIPESFIFFGVLHHIALASVLSLLFLRLPLVLVLASAIACLAAPLWFAAPVFDAPAWRWLGLMTYAPQSNDYVPILPWFAAVLIGLAASRFCLDRPAVVASLSRWRAPRPAHALLLWLGRHSLVVYLLHQPLLIGALFGVLAIAHPAALERFGGFSGARQTDQAAFAEDCVAACRVTAEEDDCRRYCDCVYNDLDDAGLLLEALRAPDTAGDSLSGARTSEIVQRCIDHSIGSAAPPRGPSPSP